MAYRIKFIKGALCGREFQIGAAPLIVGRSHKCDVHVPDETDYQDISRNHVMLIPQGDSLFVLNMSSRLTRVDGLKIPANHRMQVDVGVKIGMGKSTEFRIESDDGGLPAASVSDVATSDVASPETGACETNATMFAPDTAMPNGTLDVAAAMPTAMATAAATSAMTAAATSAATSVPAALAADAPDDSAMDIFTADEDDGEPDVDRQKTQGVDQTIAGRTVLISPEELASLIAANRTAKRRKTYRRMIVMVVASAIFAIAYLLMRPHPETSLTWPCDSTGHFDDRDVVLSSPIGDKCVTLLLPNDARAKVSESSNGVAVASTYIGRDRDVNLRLRIVQRKDRAFLKKSRYQLFDEERQRLEEAGGWNFLSTSPMGFLGVDNGIPYFEVQYLRSDKMASDEVRQWFGYLLFAVHGDCSIRFTREIPAIEQWRGGAFLARETMMNFDAKVIDGHWEGRPDFRDDPVEAMLAEADGLLSRRSPLHWQEVEFILQSVMIKTEGHGPQFDGAMKRLMKLRGDQRKEFNRLKAQSQTERTLKGGKRGKEAGPALEAARRIFSSPDDMRCELLKRGRWE